MNLAVLVLNLVVLILISVLNFAVLLLILNLVILVLVSNPVAMVLVLNPVVLTERGATRGKRGICPKFQRKNFNAEIVFINLCSRTKGSIKSVFEQKRASKSLFLDKRVL